jgi:formyltetrahydrofolate synthetase
MHSGRFRVVAGKPLSEKILKEDIDAVQQGAVNLEKHIENIRLFGLPAVVAINRFTTDTDKEIEAVRKKSLASGADDAVVSEAWAKGGEGALDLARAVVKAADKPSHFKFLYSLDETIAQKIEKIAKSVYGAANVEYSPEAAKKIELYTKLGYDKFPICMAKTHLSLSHDPELKGRPTGFTVPIRDIRLAAGAGFLYPLCGSMRTMPGLPSEPAGTRIDLDEDGFVEGLF